MTLYELLIPDELEPMRLEKYLKKALPELPATALREAFSRKDVKQNGSRVKADAMTQPGAKVQVYTAFGGEPPLKVVHEDDNLLLVDKPQGISVHEDDGVGVTMLDLAKKYLATEKVFLCHRLDNKTCGLLLFAKNEQAESLLREAFFERTMEKEYACLVKGTPKPEAAVKEAFLLKNAQEGKVRVITKGTPGTQKIVTGYEVVAPGEVSRLKVSLITGRTHQIRAHLAFLGHPILGDDLYGDRAFNKAQKAKRLMLCASRLTFHVEGCLSYMEGKAFEIKVPF